jgi:hypothetical protein
MDCIEFSPMGFYPMECKPEPQFYGTVSGIVSELTIHPGNWYSFALGKAKLNAKGSPPDWLLDGECIKIDFRSASMELVNNNDQQ